MSIDKKQLKSILYTQAKKAIDDNEQRLTTLSTQLSRPFMRIADHLFFPSKFSEDIAELRYSKAELATLYSDAGYIDAARHLEKDLNLRSKEFQDFSNRPSDEFCHLVSEKLIALSLASTLYRLLSFEKQPTHAAKRLCNWAYSNEFYEEKSTKDRTYSNLKDLFTSGSSQIIAPRQVNSRLSAILPFFIDQNIIKTDNYQQYDYLSITEKLTMIDGLLHNRKRKRPEPIRQML